MTAPERIRCLSVTPIFPGAERPEEGVFVLKRLSALPAHVDVEVVRARPWFPLIDRALAHLGPRARTERVAGLTVHDLRFFYTPRYGKQRDGARLARALLRFVRERGVPFDLLDGHFAYPTGHAAVRVAEELGLPSVVTLRGTMPAYLRDARRGPIVETLRRATKVIAVSSSLAEVARQAAGADLDVSVIGNGVDPELFGPGESVAARGRLGLPAHARILLTVGGMVPRKGAHRVIETLPALLTRHPDLLYLVVGGGGVEGDFEQELERRIDRLGVRPHVRLCGRVDPSVLADWYRAADLFVLATANEGWANVLQEALACGTPVVTTDVGGNAEVLGGPSHGLLVPFDDSGALERAIDAALATRWDRSAISAFGLGRDWRAVGREVAEVLAAALAVRR